MLFTLVLQPFSNYGRYILDVSNEVHSRTETEKKLCSHYALSGAYSVEALHSKVLVLVKCTLLKFKKLSDPKELQAFTGICDETFTLPDIPAPETSTSAPTSEDTKDSGDGSIDLSSPSLTKAKPSTSTRGSVEALTPRKRKLKKKLDFLSTSKASLAAKYCTKISELKTQMKTPKRVINQSLKRKQKQIEVKDQKIRELQQQLRASVV